MGHTTAGVRSASTTSLCSGRSETRKRLLSVFLSAPSDESGHGQADAFGEIDQP